VPAAMVVFPAGTTQPWLADLIAVEPPTKVIEAESTVIADHHAPASISDFAAEGEAERIAENASEIEAAKKRLRGEWRRNQETVA